MEQYFLDNYESGDGGDGCDDIEDIGDDVQEQHAARKTEHLRWDTMLFMMLTMMMVIMVMMMMLMMMLMVFDTQS